MVLIPPSKRENSKKLIWGSSTNPYKYIDPRENERGRMLLAESQRDDPITAEIKRQEQAARRSPKGDRPDPFLANWNDRFEVDDPYQMKPGETPTQFARRFGAHQRMGQIRGLMREKYYRTKVREKSDMMGRIYMDALTLNNYNELQALNESKAAGTYSKADVARRAKIRSDEQAEFIKKYEILGAMAHDAGVGTKVGSLSRHPGGFVLGTLGGATFGVARGMKKRLIDKVVGYDPDEEYNKWFVPPVPQKRPAIEYIRAREEQENHLKL